MEVHHWHGQVQQKCSIIGADRCIFVISRVQVNLHGSRLAEKATIIDGDPSKIVALIHSS